MEAVKKDYVNWEDPALVRWLGSIVKNGTKYLYRSAFRAYAEYTGMSASQLIQEALEDQKKDVLQRKDVVVQRIIGFYHWLKKEYRVKTRGKGNHRTARIGLSDSLAHTYVAAIRSFYQTFDIFINLKRRQRLPKPRIKNRRMRVSAEDVKLLVDHARNPRDKAIILTMFQSGMDVSTLCSLKYGDVAEGLRKGECPLKLNLQRPKTGVEYYTFIGRDAIEAIKVYLKDCEHRGIKFTDDTPLFLKEKKKGGAQAVETYLVQNMLKEVAIKAGLVDENLNGKDFNPLSPHALRESFGSIMLNSGVPDTIVDFWLGHEIGEMARAYKGVQFEKLKKIYSEREKLLSISVPKTSQDEKIAKLEKAISNLTLEKEALKTQLNQLAERIRRFEEFTQRFLKATSEELEEIGWEVFRRKRRTLKDILAEEEEVKKHQEAVAEDQKVAEKVQKTVS